MKGVCLCLSKARRSERTHLFRNDIPNVLDFSKEGIHPILRSLAFY